MNQFFKTFFACLLAIVASSILSFFFWILMLTSIISFSEETYTVGSNSILKIDLAADISDNPTINSVDNFDFTNFKINKPVSLLEAISLIEKAGEDPRISGILINSSLISPISTSSLYELRRAISDFRTASSKFVISYGDIYTQGAYYLASVSDKIYMNPQGGMDWSGMSSTVMFYKGLFDKLGIEPEIVRHGKFKGAVEPFLMDKMSPENRLQMEQIIGSVWGYIVKEIGDSRSIDSAKLQQLANDMSAIRPQAAMENGLIDDLYYKDQLITEMSKLTGEDEPRTISLSQYQTANSSAGKGNILANDQIAVVYAQGEIIDVGNSLQTGSIVGNSLAAEIRKIREDDDTKAMVLRVNSPGGSVLASDIIWREVELTQKVKPVIISMGEYAASGGYYISCPADQIVTTPTTITGSIGVFGIMFNLEKAAREKLGITVDVVRTNPMADAGGMFRALTPAERLIMQNSIDSTYVRFVNLVAQGRHISYEKVDDMASGRVWSGLQAIDNGLADKIGTIQDAINMAAEKAATTDYRIKTYPENDDSFGSLLKSVTSISTKYIKEVVGITPEIDQVKQAIEKHQGIKAKLPYDIKLK